MKRALVAIVLFIGMLSRPAVAQDEISGKTLLLLGAGYLSGHAAHEMGHMLTGKVVGVNTHFAWRPDLVSAYPPIAVMSDKNAPRNRRATTATGGFMGEIVSSEIILNSSSLQTEEGGYNYYLIGWVAQTIVNPIVYSILDSSTPGGWEGGDLQSIERLGGDKATVRAFILGHAAINFLRLGFKLDAIHNIQISSTPSSISLAVSF
jgi:hypothetical protein